MQDLKNRVYRSWEDLSVFNGAVVQAENFKAEVRQFGDLRYKCTWEAAYCQFSARNMLDSCLDAFTLITIQFNPDWWEPELLHLLPQCLDDFLVLPEGPDALRLGMEQLFGDYTTAEEKEDARGFFEAHKLCDRLLITSPPASSTPQSPGEPCLCEQNTRCEELAAQGS